MKTPNIERLDQLLEHLFFCNMVQALNAWGYVDCIRKYCSLCGESSEFENMLDVEFVALNYEVIEDLYKNPEDVYMVFELYQAWVEGCKAEETHTQCPPMINTSFSRQ